MSVCVCVCERGRERQTETEIYIERNKLTEAENFRTYVSGNKIPKYYTRRF